MRDGVSILGPSPAAKYLIRKRYHWHILIKSVELSAAGAAVTRTLEQLEAERRPGRLRFDVDVDPIEMA
jgi:primosomal protein N'